MQNRQLDTILYDEICNLCNGFVRFLMRRNNKPQFRFLTIQSTEGEQILDHYHLPKPTNPDSVVFISDNKAYQKSDAVLEILKRMDWKYAWFYGFKIIPKFLRDPVYDLIARNRYKIFGKQESCEIPISGKKNK